MLRNTTASKFALHTSLPSSSAAYNHTYTDIDYVTDTKYLINAVVKIIISELMMPIKQFNLSTN